MRVVAENLSPQLTLVEKVAVSFYYLFFESEISGKRGLF